MKHTLFCQSCSIPLEAEEMKGTNIDSSKSNEYCLYCYKEGKFVENITMKEMIEKCASFAEEMNMTKEEATAHFGKIFPTLNRWKKSGE